MGKSLSKPWVWIACGAVLAIAVKSPAIALCLGGGLSLVFGNPAVKTTSKVGKYLLQASVALLGFGLQLNIVLRAGFSSIGITLVGIGATLTLGWILGKLFQVHRDLSLLLSTGTAICGGSAIAAMAPAIGASQAHTAVAMAMVFLLNGVALLVFPPIGHAIHLSPTDFGLWCALAIHDTSSVVGAAAIYGAAALQVGTVVKLTRALWILPVSYLGAKLRKGHSAAAIPWFLLGFLMAAMLRSGIPAAIPAWDLGAMAGKRMMIATLFLIGAGLTRTDLRKIGGGAFASAVTLWIIVSMASLAAIYWGWCGVVIPAGQ